jgi:predicted enzyme related to lactoylglutathione lyase
MFRTVTAILIWSENYKRLANWYIDKLELQKIEEINHPNDTGIGLALGKMYLWVGKHNKVKGKNKDMHRIMFNIEVDSVQKTYEYLKKKGVKFLAKPFKAPTFDKYFATFYDCDDNIMQLIGGK